MTRPQLASLHLRLQRFDQLLEQRIVDIPRAAQHMIEGLDFLPYKLLDPIQFRLYLGVGLKVPGHGVSPSK
ncbi:hypothetical protein D9M69_685690 [compost metagenome]